MFSCNYWEDKSTDELLLGLKLTSFSTQMVWWLLIFIKVLGNNLAKRLMSTDLLWWWSCLSKDLLKGNTSGVSIMRSLVNGTWVKKDKETRKEFEE